MSGIHGAVTCVMGGRSGMERVLDAVGPGAGICKAIGMAIVRRGGDRLCFCCFEWLLLEAQRCVLVLAPFPGGQSAGMRMELGDGGSRTRPRLGLHSGIIWLRVV